LRRELVVFAIVLSAGVCLRIVALSHSAVEHFDEGVYASNIFFGAPEYAYPQQRFFAPPLLPALIEAGMMARLPANWAAMLPSFLAGCGTIAALWWLGRSWLGPRAGIAAAAMAAVSQYHVAFSAAALTDVLLGLWIVLAVDAIARSVGAGDIKWAVIAGLFTGLAWWTKYNGWLPLAIEGAAVGGLWGWGWASEVGSRESGVGGQRSEVRGRKSEIRSEGAGEANGTRIARCIACFLVTCAVALAVWSPYFLSLQSRGGYGPIAANHSKYVIGFAGWVDAAGRQVANFVVLDGWSSVIGLFAALVAAVLVGSRPSDAPEQAPSRVGIALLVAWWVGLLVATPCYWPYPRLLLPWLLATWLGIGVLLDLVIGRWRRGWLLPAVGAVVVTIAVGLAWVDRPAPSIWRAMSHDRRSVMTIARQVQADLDRLVPAGTNNTNGTPSRAVYVYGEPAMFFQLAAGGEAAVMPAQQVANRPAILGGRELPTFLVVGPHAERDPQFAMQLADAVNKWRVVGEYSYVPSPLVWLDLHDPRQLLSAESRKGHYFRLYQFRP
jgi:4-amino-4-deoxy-L-arabinose transferase-like glycosyltransferase